MSAEPAADLSSGGNQVNSGEQETAPIAPTNVHGTLPDVGKGRRKPYLPRGVQGATTQRELLGFGRRKSEVSQKERERAQADAVMNRLNEHIEGKCELAPTQVQAARVLLDKLKPSLQAVEYTEHESLPEEGDIISKIQALTASDPALRARLAALLLGSPQPVPGSSDKT